MALGAPSSLAIATLNATHECYRREGWAEIWALYAGGTQFSSDRFIRERRSEPPEVLEERRGRAFYLGYLGAQMRDRAGRWEGTIQTRFSSSDTVNFENGAVANLGPAAGLGLGFAYNFSNKMSAGVDFSWASQDNTYTGRDPSNGNTRSGQATAYTSTLQLNGTYNFIDGPITPYVTGFLGGTYFDSGVPDGVSNGCYWYPYYGYVCGTFTTSKTATYFTYGAGVGVRWDVNDVFFIKGGVQQQWFQIGGADGIPNFTVGRLDFGMKF